jgi:hypothetical protein
MLVKLKEIQKIDSSKIDEHGRLVSDTSFVSKELLINPEHVVCINEEKSVKGESASRIETTKGVFIVLGTPSQVHEQLSGVQVSPAKTRKVLKD